MPIGTWCSRVCDDIVVLPIIGRGLLPYQGLAATQRAALFAPEASLP